VLSAPSTDVRLHLEVTPGFLGRHPPIPSLYPRPVRRAVLAVPLLLLAGCGGSSAPSAAPAPSPSAAPVPQIVLPAGPLRDLVPRADEIPNGMLPVLAGSGPRDQQAIAAYSADPKAAATLLTEHGFRSAYVGQYADPANGRVLSVVVTRFATAAGATADLAGDLAASGGDPIAATTIGDTSQVRRQPLPGGGGQLVTVRFRRGATTWLVAYGAKPVADPAVAIGIARRLS